ncbi:hypothetical protein LguiA_017393 [Lonicera macranthoides]
MASLFALSASMQFNDPDWYFWLPLYAIACAVNLVNGVFTHKITKQVPKFGLWLGILLFIKVVLEDLLHGISGFWSLNLRDRVVREKFGSGLVISCMLLHLQVSSKTKAANYVQYGMIMQITLLSLIQQLNLAFTPIQICLYS